MWELAAGGFRDTSRVAASDTQMFLDILLTNRAAVLAQVDAFAAELGELRRCWRKKTSKHSAHGCPPRSASVQHGKHNGNCQKPSRKRSRSASSRYLYHKRFTNGNSV